jgi:uncharacterized protein
MKQLRSPLSLSLVLLLFSCARRESTPLPPGDWLGRCKGMSSDVSGGYGPPPTRYVSDKANAFSEPFSAELQGSLAAFQKKSCHHLLVATVSSLEGSTLEQYALQYANRVGLGYRRLNNGILLLLSPSTRQARIQIGCGLEDVISDAQAAEIMQRDMLPEFRQGDDEKGIRAGLDSLMALASKKTIATQFRPEGCR